MDAIVAFGKALSDPTRVRILHALLSEPLCVCELTEALELSQSTLSTHLQTLRAAGAVTTEKRGTWIIYSIAPKQMSLLKTVFEAQVTPDPRLEADTDRLHSRIRLRIEGCCPPEPKGAKKEALAAR